MDSTNEFWEAHVAAVQREGVAVTAYAERHGLSLASLYYWRRKLKAATALAAPRPPGKFLSVRIADATPMPAACTLVLPSGLRLEMATPPAPAWLAALEQSHSGVR